MFNFLFYLFLAGILLASIQDLKRREVDNILNFSLLIVGVSYVGLEAIFSKDLNLFYMLFISLILMYGLANLFYYGRVFAGGDAKLLIALTALFAASSLDFISSLKLTLVNIGIFLAFLMISGAFYGLFYSGFLFFTNFNRTKKEFVKLTKKNYNIYVWMFVFIAIVLSFINSLFIPFVALILMIPVFYAFGKSIEHSVLVKEVKFRDLREGDWILQNIKVKGKIIKASWEGLQKEDIVLLKKMNQNKSVRVKEGIPFVPAFLIAFLLYAFRDNLLGLILGI
jgi:Flp pilus assembly protein protease CpaA